MALAACKHVAKPEGCELDEGKVVCGEFVMPGGDAPTLFDLVEEALDQIARPVQILAETDGVYSASEQMLAHLSLSQTPSGWRLIGNRAMLLLDVGFVRTDLWNGDRPALVTSSA